MKDQHHDSAQITEEHVQQLQDDLAAATERSRLAKRAVKEAKAEAKIARRDKKQARKILVAAQAALDEATRAVAPVRAVTEAAHQRIPDSPEVSRKRGLRRQKDRAVVEDNSPVAAGAPAADAAAMEE